MKTLFTAILIMTTLAIHSQGYTPSPDEWRKMPMYFIMIDRFANADKSNDNFGKGEYKPDDIDFYHGGDLKGIINKLDYIEKLGVKSIWLSGHVQQQWLSPAYGRDRYSGYHGYWAHDFYKVDPHIGTLDDYKNLVKEAHKRGLYVVQDIICNHLGDFISDDGKNVTLGGYPERAAYPFDNLAQKDELFHFNGKTQFDSSFGKTLDDLNTENPYVIKNLIEIFKYWIREADIDGYRIDTVRYIPMEFWKVFVKEISDYATSLGKKNFIIFGENFEYDHLVKLEFDKADEGVALYTGTDANPIFNSMLDFSLCGAITKVFTGSKVSGAFNNDNPEYGSFNIINDRFSEKIKNQYTQISRNRLVTFLDNHDMPRFLHESKANRDPDKLKLSLGTLLTLPGVPCVYYGTEQGYYQPWGKKGRNVGTNNRQDLWESEYKTDGDLYNFIAKVNKIRNESDAITTGSYVPRIIDGNNGDIFAYSMVADNGKENLIIINRGKKSLTVRPETGLKYPMTNLITGKTFNKSIKIPAKTILIIGSK